MKVGDLVTVKQNIDEYTALLGETLGMIVEIMDPVTVPQLVQVFWSDNEGFELLYTDELEIVI